MMNFLRKYISWKLILSFALVLITVMFAVSFVVNYFSTRFIKEQIIQYNTQMLSKTIYDFDRLQDKVNQFAANSSQQYLDPQLWEENGQDYCFETLRKRVDFDMKMRGSISFNNLRSTVLGIGLFYDDAHYLYAGEGVFDSGYSISESDWYRYFLEQGSNYIFYGPMSEDFKPVNTKKNEIFMYIRKIPVSSSFPGEQPPVIFLTIQAQEIYSILQQLDSENRLVCLTDETGELLYSNRELEAGFDITKLKDKVSKNQDGHQGYAAYSDSDIFITSMDVSSYNWVLYTIDDNHNLFKSAYDLTRNINIIIAFCGIAGIIVAIYLSKRLMMPIQVLNSFMKTIEEEPDTFIKVKGNDEIAQIGTRMNQMKLRIGEINRKIFLSQVREKEAQLSALQAQINPHFLYNTLDNIYCIAQIEEITAITRLTKALSDMLRYSIDFQDPYVTLAEELDHVRSYVSIINERYEDGIALNMDVDESLKNIIVLKMILQPIVENAWKHGILPKRPNRGTITVKARMKTKEQLELRVCDDGIGMDEKTLIRLKKKLQDIPQEAAGESEEAGSSGGFGIALTNVNDRIRLKSEGKYGIYIKSVQEIGAEIVIVQQVKQ